jgi:hypothetical protein
MNRLNKLIFLFFLSAMVLQACNLPISTINDPSANLALTITAQAQIIEQAVQSSTPSLTPVVIVITATPQDATATTPPQETATKTPAPSFTDTPAPSSTSVSSPTTGAPAVTVSTSTNCRTGPGQAYPSIYGLPVGVSANVVGKNASVNYWVIEIPNTGGKCWLWGQYATVTGDIGGLPTVAIPPMPTFTSSPIPAAPSNISVSGNTCVGDPQNQFGQIITGVLTWTDNSNNETGFHIYTRSSMSGAADVLVTTVGANATSYSFNIYTISHTPEALKLEAFNAAGTSKRVTVNVDLSGCP